MGERSGEARGSLVLISALLDDDRITRAARGASFGDEDYGPSIKDAIVAVLEDMGVKFSMPETPPEGIGLYPLRNPWRVGRKVGRTIYAQIGSEPHEDDVLIGVMDTPELARAAVEAHNEAVTQ